MKKENKIRIIKVILMEGDKQVAYFSVPITEGYVKIINKWLKSETCNLHIQTLK